MVEDKIFFFFFNTILWIIIIELLTTLLQIETLSNKCEYIMLQSRGDVPERGGMTALQTQLQQEQRDDVCLIVTEL